MANAKDGSRSVGMDACSGVAYMIGNFSEGWIT